MHDVKRIVALNGRPQGDDGATNSALEFIDSTDSIQEVLASELIGKTKTSRSVLTHYLRFDNRTRAEVDWLVDCQRCLQASAAVGTALHTLRNNDDRPRRRRKQNKAAMYLPLVHQFLSSFYPMV